MHLLKMTQWKRRTSKTTVIRNGPAVPANFLPKSGSARMDSHLAIVIKEVLGCPCGNPKYECEENNNLGTHNPGV